MWIITVFETFVLLLSRTTMTKYWSPKQQKTNNFLHYNQININIESFEPQNKLYSLEYFEYNLYSLENEITETFPKSLTSNKSLGSKRSFSRIPKTFWHVFKNTRMFFRQRNWKRNFTSGEPYRSLKSSIIAEHYSATLYNAKKNYNSYIKPTNACKFEIINVNQLNSAVTMASLTSLWYPSLTWISFKIKYVW